MSSHNGADDEDGRTISLNPDLPLPLRLSWDDLGDDDEIGDPVHPSSPILRELRRGRPSQARGGAPGGASTAGPLGRLPPDVSAAILSHLTVRDVASASEASPDLYAACRNPDLWRALFAARWDYDDPTIRDWFLAYRRAYWNPHDLWITHWNCADSSDGLGPGRCCIQDGNSDDDDDMTDSATKSASNVQTLRHRCPNCRYHPTLTKPSRRREVDPIGTESDTRGAPTAAISTLAQAIQAATDLRLGEGCPTPDGGDDIGHSQSLGAARYSSRRAERAFAKSSTFHRRLDTHQYRDRSLCFLQDLLFFQTHDTNDTDDDDEPVEIKDWKHHHRRQNRHAQEGGGAVQHAHQEGDAFETALHSWHLAKFSNPDRNCPIVWRISIQRPDCFTVFPSEGLLRPGESKVIVFGVKPLASALAYATDQLNVHREGVDEFWANLYAEEAHLPFAPFLIHYHHASVVPCRRADDDPSLPSSRPPSSHPPRHPNPHSIPNVRAGRPHRRRRQDAHTDNDSNNILHPAESPWQQSAQPQQPIHTLYLSAHVNANYTLTEFRRRTLVPFALPRHPPSRTWGLGGTKWSPVVYCAPQLMEFYPKEWQGLQNLVLEEPWNNSTAALRYRTEAACEDCGLTWGPRSEELGQAYVLAKLEGEQEWRRQRQRLEGLYRLLGGLVQSIRDQKARQGSLGTSVTRQSHHLVFLIHRKVMNFRGASWLSHRDSRVLVQWEILLDTLSRIHAMELPANERGNSLHWRHSGVYRHALCTGSVFDAEQSFDKNGNEDLLIASPDVLWKEEPKYLEPFAHLAHSPGLFCLGPQEDPNHLSGSKLGSKFVRRQMGCATDMFMDDPICGLQAAICAVSNPRSLLVHGIYDRVPYPGSVVRRPKLPILSRLDKRSCHLYLRANYHLTLSAFIESFNQLFYYELQNSLDVESMLLVNSMFDPRSDLHSVPYSVSLRNFLRNVPPLANGRFAVSMERKESNANHEDHEMAGRNQYWYLDTSISEITEYCLPHESPGDSDASTDSSAGSDSDSHNQGGNHPPNDNLHFQPFAAMDHNVMLPRGPRVLNLLWVLSAHLGWTLDDNQGDASVYVDRRILIGAQWLSLSIMTAPLLWTLCARYAQWIPSAPVDYPLEALPFHVETKLRFLTETECGYCALLLLSLYLVLGRWVERNTSRDFVRAMAEHMPIENGPSRGVLGNLSARILRWLQRRWDAVCPLYLQRLVFVPPWNRRSPSAVMKHIAFWRGQNFRDAASVFRAQAGRGRIFYEGGDASISLADEPAVLKVLIGATACLGSFSASSPHFVLNVLTVFSSSISLGLSMSLQSMETGRAGVVVARTAGSVVRALSLVTVVILGVLVGQLVGSSGGVLFLAEFIVTSISLVLGGGGTVSASAMESWLTFFCFAATAFLGYLLGRVAVMDGMRQKRSGFSSVVLVAALAALSVFWTIAAAVWEWETAVQLAIVRPPRAGGGHRDGPVGEPRRLP